MKIKIYICLLELPKILKNKIMNSRILSLLIILLVSFKLDAQTALPPGYPDRTASFDALPGFVNPPKGYGEVPFFWWQGDTLTHERLLWQLDQLKNKGISSLQINYSHRDTGGLIYGWSNPSKPALFTDAWWKLFKWFAAEAQKQGMTVSLSDYTLGIGQGFAIDEAISSNPDLNGSELKGGVKIVTGSITLEMPDNILTLNGYQIRADSSIITESKKELLALIKDGKLKYTFGSEKWKLITVYSQRLIPSYDPMHPESGKAYNHFFFDKFEKALKESGSGALNFFFSDELNFRVSGNLWDNLFAAQFKKRKGYDVVPYLDALYENIGPITPKIRLDYNDVMVSLSEENFFEPVYQWHQDRGLIFGCDHGGRGREVAEFGDYFRTQRWNQGPGSDQPRVSKDIVKAKIASSISHLYDRPRVWLEGFHSSGWSTSSSDVTDAIFGNFVAGYNLLSFHGLYYSTMGGWWEWAPPCNHFRMPYWKQMDPLMNCVQRISFLLSQGIHNCDVAILYPTEPVIAYPDGQKSVDIAFEAGERLYDKGVDFDYIDYESLARGAVKEGALQVSGEKYKVLVVPSMKAIRYASLQKLEAFKKGGGIIVNMGQVPEATEKGGSNDPETKQLVSALFANGKNMIQCDDPKVIVSAIADKYSPNFKILTPITERPYVMHRVIGKRDIYALYKVPQGARCFFKAKGAVQLWNPWNGETSSIAKFATPTNDGTEVILPISGNDLQLIIFDPDNTTCTNELKPEKTIRESDLGSTWNFELKPSLDNQWGDFQLPAKPEMLGAQVRQLHFSENDTYTGGDLKRDASWRSVTCGYGKQFLKIGGLESAPSEQDLVNLNPDGDDEQVSLSGKLHHWTPYGFSWKQGVEGDPGHQGYHGLKGEMYDNFIRLGAFKDIRMSNKRVDEATGKYYVLYTTVIAPSDGKYDLLTGEIKPGMLIVNHTKIDPNSKTIGLKKGANPIVIRYDQGCETYLIMRKPGAPRPKKVEVAMSWYTDSGILPFDCSFNKTSSALYTFNSAPGLETFTFGAYGKVTVWIDGIKTELNTSEKIQDGINRYSVTLKNHKQTTTPVVIKIDYQKGFQGGGAIPEYIEQHCIQGSINLGDWSMIDGMKAYSGGAWYRKSIQLNSADLKEKLLIDLGDLVSSAELRINGQSAGVRLSPPWKFDITLFAKLGENTIEILVYNTIANNYTTVPTKYLGSIKSGLIGPVRLLVNHYNE